MYFTGLYAPCSTNTFITCGVRRKQRCHSHHSSQGSMGSQSSALCLLRLTGGLGSDSNLQMTVTTVHAVVHTKQHM
jgi:hypothetical protein